MKEETIIPHTFKFKIMYWDNVDGSYGIEIYTVHCPNVLADGANAHAEEQAYARAEEQMINNGYARYEVTYLLE